MNQCIFCDIVNGIAQASRVYEDDHCCAFMDIQPVNQGHVLVVPKIHAGNLSEMDVAAGVQVWRTAHKIALALRQTSIKCEGINFFLADGEAAGQEVFHVHLHIIPRFHGDGFGLTFSPNYFQLPPRSELDQTAEQIKNAI